jgi:hypothetical protein
VFRNEERWEQDPKNQRRPLYPFSGLRESALNAAQALHRPQRSVSSVEPTTKEPTAMLK